MRKILFAAISIIGFATISVETAFTQMKVQALAQSDLSLVKAKSNLAQAKLRVKDDDDYNSDYDEFFNEDRAQLKDDSDDSDDSDDEGDEGDDEERA
jgi:hypothetical protein